MAVDARLEGLSLKREARTVADTAPAPLAVRSRDLSTRSPFRGRPHDEAVRDATLTGTLPEWLRGGLVRTAPAVFTDGPWEAHHWFDALGMLYAFRIGDGSVKYRQKLVGSDVAAAAREGRTPRASFGTPIARGFWKRLFQPIPDVTDNPNVNVTSLGDERVALTESPHQWAFDEETLAVTKKVEYADAHGELAMIAHPHFDFRTGRVVSLAGKLGFRSEVILYEHAPNSRERTVLGRVRAARMPYVHSFGLTKRHAIVIGHPFDVSPLSFLWSNRGFIDHFTWRPDAGTTLWLIDRSTGAVREHAAPPGFVFHVVNAFEDGETTSIDVALYQDPTIVSALSTEALARDGLPDLDPSLVRWTMRDGVRDALVETLADDGFELPSVSYKQKSGERHAVVWGARIGARATRSAIIRFDGNAERTFEEPGWVFGEPLFVARPGAEREDDGVLLSVASHRDEDRSAMFVLDAATLDVRATAEVPIPIPLGFHGAFWRAG
jgi:carotenoid cleavage dioxygenase-like enzyme